MGPGKQGIRSKQLTQSSAGAAAQLGSALSPLLLLTSLQDYFTAKEEITSEEICKIHITIKLEGKTKPQIPSIPISPAQLQARANHCTFPFRDQFPVTWGQCHQPNTQREHVWSRALFKQSPLFGPASEVCLKKPFRSRRHLCANPALLPAWHCRLWLRWLCFHRTAAS